VIGPICGRTSGFAPRGVTLGGVAFGWPATTAFYPFDLQLLGFLNKGLDLRLRSSLAPQSQIIIGYAAFTAIQSSTLDCLFALDASLSAFNWTFAISG
jgi:hypothetical protein